MILMVLLLMVVVVLGHGQSFFCDRRSKMDNRTHP